ncbi:metalloregulator ArsR/SmtB family transcription factor [Herminiimonas sp. CN]|uniref:helix-turn-helix transcriptional regulator n=1 Tax=Herminiimonas sp. CN TaxID=1349818 RepID=UPI0004742AB2|nr:HTH domain-containing protein [Herminiimonas sp. CN]
MLETLGIRQKELLKLLLKKKAGMTADELSEQLAITRNAVRQHLAALENDRLVRKSATRPSGGRPQQLYALTDKGHELFPRHYSWLAQLLLESMQDEAGADAVGERLSILGERVAAQLRSQHPALQQPQEAVQELAAIMEQMGYAACGTVDASNTPVIEADNCVFHNLAMQNPDVCKFDLALLSSFTGSTVEHHECMAKGGNVCRFKFHPKKG